MTTIPTLSEVLNDEFTNTWYEIRAEAIDNILKATPVTAMFRNKGRFMTQVGGRFIERTIRYGEKVATSFGKGDVLAVSEEELETVALWTQKFINVPITRTFVDDQQNSGPEMIKPYVTKRLNAAREALVQKIESIIMGSAVVTGDDPNSLFDAYPANNSTDYYAGSTTYGGIRRDNIWWQHEDFTKSAGTAHQYGPKSGPASLTMYDDMSNVMNTANKQLKTLDCIITTQTMFEVYEGFAVAKEQIIRQETTDLANLGFSVLQFRGQPLVWSENMASNQMLMINSDFIDFVYDPNVWFDMTSWERPERQLEQVAFLLLSLQIVGYNPRFNARILWSDV